MRMRRRNPRCSAQKSYAQIRTTSWNKPASGAPTVTSKDGLAFGVLIRLSLAPQMNVDYGLWLQLGLENQM